VQRQANAHQRATTIAIEDADIAAMRFDEAFTNR
jgi:hypothetical protein